MGDYDHYGAAQVTAGKTVPLALTFFNPHPMASGHHPVLDVEHIGDTNEAFLNDMIARSNARVQIGEDTSKLSKKKLSDIMEKNRDTLIKYSVKGMRYVYKKGGTLAIDGKPKPGDDPEAPTCRDTDQLAAFIRSWSQDVVHKVWTFVTNAENYRETVIHGDARELAEKS